MGGPGIYNYVGQSPVMGVDPSGESAQSKVASGILADLLFPDPTDAAPHKWLGYGAAMCVAIIADYALSTHVADSECLPCQEHAGPLPMAEHTKARPSTQGKHEKGRARNKTDAGGEKGDDKREPKRKKPPEWKGPWPPKR